MSSDLIWMLIKDNSSFLVKRPGVQFSREAPNLTNLNTPKYCGLASDKALAITAAPGGRGVVLATKKTRTPACKPRALVHRTTLNGSVRKNAKTITNVIGKSGYRPDLNKAALARLSALSHAQK